jgi:hypothetical protein
LLALTDPSLQMKVLPWQCDMPPLRPLHGELAAASRMVPNDAMMPSTLAAYLIFAVPQMLDAIRRVFVNSSSQACRNEPRRFRARRPHLGVAEPCILQGSNDIIRLPRGEDVGWHVHPIHTQLRKKAQHDASAWLENACKLRGTSFKALPEVHCVDAKGFVECGIGQGQVLDRPDPELGSPDAHRIGVPATGGIHDILRTVNTADECRVPEKLPQRRSAAESDLHDTVFRNQIQLIESIAIQSGVAAIHAGPD